MMESGRSLYQPLDSSKHQFRLIKVVDDVTGFPRCHLATYSLLEDSLPQWKAISYRWGDDEPRLTIDLDGHQVLVRNNIYTFLRQVVIEKGQDWFFIDALCIDQSNDVEKMHQVCQMSEIYRKADVVLAWIVMDPCQLEDVESTEGDNLPHNEDFLASMSRSELETVVAENSYWSRLWILQEVLLAKCLTIRIGSAEVDWLTLLTEMSKRQRGKILPSNNETLEARESGEGSNVNKITAVDILSFRRFEASSLRNGNHIPFHKAFNFFAMQDCSNTLDKVFGYIGLTNSRIKVDYSMPVIELFVATLAEYFMSVGLITEDWMPWRKRPQFIRTAMSSMSGNNLVVPFLAFELDPFDPAIFLLFRTVTKFFVPGHEDNLTNLALAAWWSLKRRVLQQYVQDVAESDHAIELRYIGSVCFKGIKLVMSEHKAYQESYKTLRERQGTLAKEDALMSAVDGGQEKRYSEWASYATDISEQMWQQYQESGQEAAGDLDDESWTLVA